MNKTHYYFCGGGTGGHIYPGIAIAQQITKADPNARITFFCSKRPIDKQILMQTSFGFITLPAKGFSLRPIRLIQFCWEFYRSYLIAKNVIKEATGRRVIISVGGFVSAPVLIAAKALKLRIAMLNVDIVPGRANKLLARFASEIFVQFPETPPRFNKIKAKFHVTGCPLRVDFQHHDNSWAIKDLELDTNKNTLLITGASSGSENINNVICSLLDELDNYADRWQIIHIAGSANFLQVSSSYENYNIAHKILPYYNNMPSVYAAADLVVGRAGAVSIAEYAAAGVPAICLPYPYHKDKHQYLNAEKLVSVGGAVIVDDLADPQKTAEVLSEHLFSLMQDSGKRHQMAEAAGMSTNLSAAEVIARQLLTM